MRKWKRIMSVLLTGVVLLGNSLYIVPERVQAADGEGLKGTIESKIPFGNNEITCLGPVGGTVGEGQKMFTWTKGGGDDQNWTAEEIEGKGIYRLSLTKNGTTLYLAENGTQVGADAVLTAASAEDTAGQWVFETAKGTDQEGYYRIKNVKNHLYLTTKRTDATSSRDLTVELNEAMESDSQLWKPGFAVKEATDIPDPEPDPDENAIKGYLTCMEAPAQHLSVDGGLSTDGAKMIIWSGPQSNQEWVFQPVEEQNAEKGYVIKNRVTQKVLAANDSAKGSQLVQKTYAQGDGKQIWIFETIGSDTGYRMKNQGTGLYAAAGDTKNGAKVCQNDLDSFTSLQVWATEANVLAVEGSPLSKVEDEDFFRSLADQNQCLAVSGGSMEENAEIATWTGPEVNQKWKLQKAGESEGEYYLVNISSQKAISAPDMKEGKRLIQKSIEEGDAKQIWTFIKAENGRYRIKNKETRLYLTADVSASGSRVLQKNYMDSPLQIWCADERTVIEPVQNTEDYAIKIWIKEGVTVTADKGSAVTKGESVTFTLTPRVGYEVRNMEFFVNDVKQTLADGENGVRTCTVENVSEDMTVKAGADVTCLNGYVYIPENDYTGRNQCLSPRVVEALDGTLYATFENGIPSEIEEGEYSFPVYESKDKGDTWKRVGEIINDDKIHPDSYYKITKYTDVGAPSEAVEVQQGEEGAIRHPWSLQCCPQLFILPEDQGELKKGTLVCAGVAVPLEEGAEKVSDAGYGGLWESSLDFYYSTDGGRSWNFKSTIAEGGENGRNIMGYDPVWEPFFLYHEKNLICYYSDETDPQHAQKLVYKITTDGGATWGEPVDIVSINNRGARPGMPIVTELENGDWMMVYETVGMTNPIKSGVKIAKDPYNWNPSEPGPTLPGIRNVYGGSPYVFTLKDGRVVAGTGSLSEVFVNTENDGTGEWVAKATGAPAGYNRCFFQLSTGEFFITGTEGPGFASQNNKIFAKRVWADEALDVTLDHIEVTAPAKTSYKIGEELDLTGMNAEAVYSDGSKKDITEKVRIEGFDTSAAGRQKITVTYGKKTAEFTVTVRKVYKVKVSYRAEEGSVKAEEGDTWKEIGRDEIIEILEDGSQKFQIVPSEGYEIANVRLGEESVLDQVTPGADGSGTITLEGMALEGMPSDITLMAVFKAKEAAYRIRPGVNGTITADKPLAGAGEEVTFTFTPADKYELTDVLVNDQSVIEKVTVDSETKTGTLKITVEQDMVISAVFKQIYKIKVSYRAEEGSIKAEEGGTWKEIGRDETVEIEEDGSQKFQIVPSEGYEIANVRLGEESVLDQVTPGADGSGTITLEGMALEGMPSDITLMAVFKAKEAAYRIRPGVNGTITADKPLAGAGEEVTFTFTPADKYELTDVLVNDQSVIEKVTVDSETKTGTLKITVEQDMVISAVFEQPVVLTGIEVTAPEKTVYKTGESLDLTGMKVTAVYSDGSTKDVTGEAKAEGFDSSAAGAKQITVTYKGKTAEFTVTVEKSGEEKPGGDKPGVQKPVTVSKIKITGISKKVAAGKKIQLTATVSPSNAANKAIEWKSGNKKVATVNSKGIVTMKKNSGGRKVTITAIAKDTRKVKASYTITSAKGKVKKVSITGKKTVRAGKTLKLAAKVKAEKGANKKIKWKSSNTKYATVSSSGKVKAKKAGKKKTVKVTAMATDGTNKKATITIKIK